MQGMGTNCCTKIFLLSVNCYKVFFVSSLTGTTTMNAELGEYYPVRHIVRSCPLSSSVVKALASIP